MSLVMGALCLSSVQGCVCDVAIDLPGEIYFWKGERLVIIMITSASINKICVPFHWSFMNERTIYASHVRLLHQIDVLQRNGPGANRQNWTRARLEFGNLRWPRRKWQIAR